MSVYIYIYIYILNSLWGGSQRKPIGSLALFQVHRATRYSFVSDMLTQSNKGPDFEMGGNRSHGKHGSSEGLSEEDASLSHALKGRKSEHMLSD